MSDVPWNEFVVGMSDDSADERSGVAGLEGGPVITGNDDGEAAPAVADPQEEAELLDIMHEIAGYPVGSPHESPSASASSPVPAPVQAPVLIPVPVEQRPPAGMVNGNLPPLVDSRPVYLPAPGWSEQRSPVYAERIAAPVDSDPSANLTVDPRNLSVPGPVVSFWTGLPFRNEVEAPSPALMDLINSGVPIDPLSVIDFNLVDQFGARGQILVPAIGLADVAPWAPAPVPAPAPAVAPFFVDDPVEPSEDEDLYGDSISEISELTDLSNMSEFSEFEEASAASVAVESDSHDDSDSELSDVSIADSDEEEEESAEEFIVIHPPAVVPVFRGRGRGRARGSGRGGLRGGRGGRGGSGRPGLRSATRASVSAPAALGVPAASGGRGRGSPRGAPDGLSLRSGRFINHGIMHPASAAAAAGVAAACQGSHQPIPVVASSSRASGSAARASHPAVAGRRRRDSDESSS